MRFAHRRPALGGDPLQSPRLSTTPPNPAGRDFPLGVAGFTYQDLHRESRLAELDALVSGGARRRGARPSTRACSAYRARPDAVGALERSRLLVDGARPLGAFVARLFGIEAEWRRQDASTGPEAVLFRFRRDFLMRRVVKTKLPDGSRGLRLPARRRASRRRIERDSPSGACRGRPTRSSRPRDAAALLELESRLRRGPPPEEDARGLPGGARGRPRRSARARPAPRHPAASPPARPTRTARLLRSSSSDMPLWCHLRLSIRLWRAQVRRWISFQLPGDARLSNPSSRPIGPIRPSPRERVGPAREPPPPARRLQADRPPHEPSARSSARRTTACSATSARRTPARRASSTPKTAACQKNPLGIALDRLPARREDLRDAPAAPARATPSPRSRSSCVDNPMCPGTGHRICNDCMKGCIFQKQDPVNIPQIETGVLTDVLELPWGVEIYGLLTRWNPLNLRAPVRAAVQRQERARRRARARPATRWRTTC